MNDAIYEIGLTAAVFALREWVDDESHNAAVVGATPAMLAQVAVDAYRGAVGDGNVREGAVAPHGTPLSGGGRWGKRCCSLLAPWLRLLM